MDTRLYLSYWADRYKSELTEDILPFWLRHGLDHKHGGIYTCLDRDGSLMDTTKSVWFQGRAGFTFAYAYNHIDQRPEYLEASKSCIDFLLAHCFNQEGRMYFEVMADGTPLRLRRYVFSETFAIIAMSEYSIATGDRSYAERALELFLKVQGWLTSGALPPKYLPHVKGRSHSIIMICLNVAAQLRKAIADPRLDEQIERSIHELKTYFMKPEYKALLESVGEDGQVVDTIAGRTINPGHCIETAWFIMDEVKYRGGDKELLDMALTILDWSWEWGWDKEYGGIINFRDCKGFPAQDYSQDMKFWWPQSETIIATLYAYQLTGDEKYLKMHKAISDWTYAHFPDAVHGEWFGYLHRDGSVAQPAKGNIFKGPFHIPRMLTKSYLLCKEMLEAEGASLPR